MENLYEVLLGSLEDPEMVKWLAGQYLTPEKNPLTADKMSGLITEISKKHLPELLGMFMEIQRKKFGAKKKKVDFLRTFRYTKACYKNRNPARGRREKTRSEKQIKDG